MRSGSTLCAPLLGLPSRRAPPHFRNPRRITCASSGLPWLSRSKSEHFEARAKYYDYGVVSIELDQPFSLDWPELVERSVNVLADPSVEQRAMDLLKPRLVKAGGALVNPYPSWLDEDYVIITVFPESADENAADLLDAARGADCANRARRKPDAFTRESCRRF